MANEQDKFVRLLTVDEVKEWLALEFWHLNPDYKPFFLMGVEALYVKLGGEKFINIIMPGEKRDKGEVLHGEGIREVLGGQPRMDVRGLIDELKKYPPDAEVEAYEELVEIRAATGVYGGLAINKDGKQLTYIELNAPPAEGEATI